MERFKDLFDQYDQLALVTPFGHINTCSGKVTRARGLNKWYRSFVNQDGENRYKNIAIINQLLSDSNDLQAALLKIPPIDIGRTMFYSNTLNQNAKVKDDHEQDKSDIQVIQQQFFDQCQEKIKHNLLLLCEKQQKALEGINQLMATTYANDAPVVAQLLRLYHFCTLQIKRSMEYYDHNL